MLRAEYSLTYTSAISYVETKVIDSLVDLSKRPERSEEEERSLQSLQEILPEVEQARVTVMQVNGLGKALYERLANDARLFFTDTTGIEFPVKMEELAPEAQGILNLAFNACAALSATTKFETRTTKPVITESGMEFDDSVPWTVIASPGPYKTVGDWVNDCPDTLQRTWANLAYDANPELWRRGMDGSAKNFAAVSVTGLKKR